MDAKTETESLGTGERILDPNFGDSSKDSSDAVSENKTSLISEVFALSKSED
jgi:hypothetical protein